MRFLAFTTLCIGAVAVTPKRYARVEEVATAAAAAKHKAKTRRQGAAVVSDTVD
jgi:hypothetical protein